MFAPVDVSQIDHPESVPRRDPRVLRRVGQEQVNQEHCPCAGARGVSKSTKAFPCVCEGQPTITVSVKEIAVLSERRLVRHSTESEEVYENKRMTRHQ
jgi:hypothetical protein